MNRSILRAAVLGVAISCTSVTATARPLAPLAPPSPSELNLSPAQQQEWLALQEDAKALRRQLVEDLQANLPELQAALAQPDVDLGLLTQNVQSQVLFALWQTQPIRQRRLAFYESLNPQQQALVRAWLIGVTERIERGIVALQMLQIP